MHFPATKAERGRAVFLEFRRLVHQKASSPQLHVVISKTSASVLVDCQAVSTKAIEAAGNISTAGTEVLGRMVRSRGQKENSAPVRPEPRRHRWVLLWDGAATDDHRVAV